MKNMKNAKLVIATLLLLGSITLLTLPPELIPRAHATSPLEIFLQVPKTASPGQTIAIEFWTIYENGTGAPTGFTRPDLAFNHTNVQVANTTLTFGVKTNLGPVPPHVHTPGGSFVALGPIKQWVHPGAWNTSYSVPSQLGLYGVHIYANYTVIPSPRGAPTSYIAQAETTFSVQPASATSADVSGLASASIVWGVLGLAAVAVVLDLLILFWKRSPLKPK